MLMQIKLNKWGNSWALRLPANYLKELNIDPKQAMDLKLENDRIILKKANPQLVSKYTLEELLDGITPTMKHGEIWNDSESIGKELW